MCTEIGLCSALKTKAKELKVRVHGGVCVYMAYWEGIYNGFSLLHSHLLISQHN